MFNLIICIVLGMIVGLTISILFFNKTMSEMILEKHRLENLRTEVESRMKELDDIRMELVQNNFDDGK